MTTASKSNTKGVRIPDPHADSVTVDSCIGATIELMARNEATAMQYFQLCVSTFGFAGEAAEDYARRCGIAYRAGWGDVSDAEL